jgi:RHS repeat-associated protein
MPPPSKHSPCVGIRTCSDYSPFGVELDGRTVSGGYRFGYQGSEKDNEFKGNGNSYTTEFRQLDPRLGRWLSVDPLLAEFSELSPYSLSFNSSLFFNDINGDRPLPVNENHNNLSWRIESGYGTRNVISNPKASKFHRGIDLNAGSGFDDYGALVLATHDGIITKINESTNGGGGRYIQITSLDGSFQTQYLHLSDVSVYVGQKVDENQPIGKVGASAFGSEKGTASHLHYEIKVLKNGVFVNIDPLFDSDENANTNNDITKVVDPQMWVNGTYEVGTLNPLKVQDVPEITVKNKVPMIKLEPNKIEQIPMSNGAQKLIPSSNDNKNVRLNKG